MFNLVSRSDEAGTPSKYIFERRSPEAMSRRDFVRFTTLAGLENARTKLKRIYASTS